jgi:ubiquinone/menaquinone biosynthesis C-methylase UbiE
MNVNVFAKRLMPGFEGRLLVRRILNWPRDVFEDLTHRRDPMIPPHGLWFVGGEKQYKEVNEEFMRYFVELGGIQPHHRVLDVGCGPGVMGARLTRFLLPSGTYCGMDIVRAGIDWGQRNITSRFPNFRFVHVDVLNKHYNPRGRLSPSEFRFPFDDAEFDFVYLKSVFTHLLPETIAHYLCEVRRVLKCNGRCLATLFLLNDVSTALIDHGKAAVPFPDKFAECRVSDAKFPETAVAVPEEEFLQRCDESAMRVEGNIHYGSWCGRTEFMSFQDIVVLRPGRIAISKNQDASREGRRFPESAQGQLIAAP